MAPMPPPPRREAEDIHGDTHDAVTAALAKPTPTAAPKHQPSARAPERQAPPSAPRQPAPLPRTAPPPTTHGRPTGPIRKDTGAERKKTDLQPMAQPTAGKAPSAKPNIPSVANVTGRSWAGDAELIADLKPFGAELSPAELALLRRVGYSDHAIFFFATRGEKMKEQFATAAHGGEAQARLFLQSRRNNLPGEIRSTLPVPQAATERPLPSASTKQAAAAPAPVRVPVAPAPVAPPRTEAPARPVEQAPRAVADATAAVSATVKAKVQQAVQTYQDIYERREKPGEDPKRRKKEIKLARQEMEDTVAGLLSIEKKKVAGAVRQLLDVTIL